MLKGEVTILNSLGLHARAAARLVRAASVYKSEILLSTPDDKTVVNAKSILSLLTLAATTGESLVLTVDGEDEETAFDTVKRLFASGFGEM